MKTFKHVEKTYFPMDLQRELLKVRRKYDSDSRGRDFYMQLVTKFDEATVIGTPAEFDRALLTHSAHWARSSLGSQIYATVRVVGSGGVLLEFTPRVYGGHDGDGAFPNRVEEGYTYWWI